MKRQPQQMTSAEADVPRTTAMSTLSLATPGVSAHCQPRQANSIHQLSRNSSTRPATEKLCSQHGWEALIPQKCVPAKYHTEESELQSAPTQGFTKYNKHGDIDEEIDEDKERERTAPCAAGQP